MQFVQLEIKVARTRLRVLWVEGIHSFSIVSGKETLSGHYIYSLYDRFSELTRRSLGTGDRLVLAQAV